MTYIVDQEKFTITFLKENGKVFLSDIVDITERCFPNHDISSIYVKVQKPTENHLEEDIKEEERLDNNSYISNIA